MHDAILWIMYSILVIIGIIALYQKYPEWKRTRQAKKERARLFLIKTVQLAQQANREFDILTSVETGFFSNHSLMQWKETFSQLWSDMDLPSLEAARRNNEVLKQFINTYDNASYLRDEFNAGFVEA